MLLEAGAGLLSVACGADGVVIVNHERTQRVPAFTVDVEDTTGCGDASSSAGFVYGMHLGRQPGDFDLAAADAFAAKRANLPG